MRIGPRFLLALTLPMFLFASALPAFAQTTLRLKFKEGEKFEYVSDQLSKISMNIGGMDLKIGTKQVIDMNWMTEKVRDDGQAEMKLKISRVKFTMSGAPMGDIIVDSDDAQMPDDATAKVMAQAMKAIAGLEMTFTMSTTGEMSDVKISEKTLEALKALPGSDKLGDGLFTPEGLKNMAQGNVTLPKRAVKKGDSWQQKNDMKLPFGKADTVNQYTYEGPIDKEGKVIEKIGMKTDLTLKADANSPVKLTTKDVKSNGTIEFDNSRGRVIGMTNTMTMLMVIEVNNMTIDQNIETSVTMRLKDDRPRSRK